MLFLNFLSHSLLGAFPQQGSLFGCKAQAAGDVLVEAAAGDVGGWDGGRVCVGCDGERDGAVVEVVDGSYGDGLVTYHVGKVLEVIRGEENK